MDAKLTDEEIVSAAVDSLLLVVAKSADDLRAFHDALATLRRDGPLPFPRAFVSTAETIVEQLTRVEEKLREVAVAAGL